MKYFYFCSLLLLIISCDSKVDGISSSVSVSNSAELNHAIKEAKPGTEIVMTNGTWENIEIEFKGYGSMEKPIVLRAETAGEVFIEGKSNLQLGGEYLMVNGLTFQNGYSPSSSVIEFSINQDTVAHSCRVAHCVIKDYNKLQRNKTDLWVKFKGRNNQLDHCYLAGKSNRGPTVRVDLEGNQSIKNFHKITNNHFGPRAPKGGPSAETIQIGNSYTSMAPSYTLVADNLFEKCNGEVEVISSKTNFNEFRNNVFFKCEGSLVTRHGNYCIVDGNYFIGDESSKNFGGIRLIGSGHWVTNNYFNNIHGENFRSPLAVMNGIPKSPLNRYIQVTDVVVAYNSWFNCSSPLQFGVGVNLDQKEVLPPSEIRSARPIRTIVANNLIYNEKGDPMPVVAHDKLDGIQFKSNIINNQKTDFKTIVGIEEATFDIDKLSEHIWTTKNTPDIDLFNGFEFETITKDLFGEERSSQNKVGAIASNPTSAPDILNYKNYGPKWYNPNAEKQEQKVHNVSNVAELQNKLAKANPGDIIELAAGNYNLTSPLSINKAITIKCDPNNAATINYNGNSRSPLFEMHPIGNLNLKHVTITGNKSQYAFASLKANMSNLYNLDVDNCSISNFDYILKAYKYSFAGHINFNATTFSNCNNGLELSEEIEDKGEYNAENISITNCQFNEIAQNVVDYYRGGYDESTVGGNLLIHKSTFTNCGDQEKNKVLINTYGIINVLLSENTFKNNPVKHVAVLWGAKNNEHKNNSISNSGNILVEENLKLNLLY